MKGRILLMSILLSSMLLKAQHGSSQHSNIREGENRYVHNWTMEFFKGVTFKPNIQLYTFGLDYEHRIHAFNDHFAFGFLVDYELSAIEQEILITPMLFYFLGHHWKFGMGGGYNHVRKQYALSENTFSLKSFDIAVFRLGIAKEFDLDENFILAPSVFFDCNKVSSSIVFGIGIGFGN